MERLQELIQRTDTIQKINALQERVCKELFIYPRIDKKEKTKRFLKKYLLFRPVPPVDRFFWPNALLARGLSEVCRGTADTRSMKALEQYLGKWLRLDMPVFYLDNVTNGVPLLELYEKTGNEKYRQGSERLASYLLKYPRDTKGNLPYRLRDGSHIYADGIGMICPFLCRYGVITGEEAAVKLGVAQMVHFLEDGLDEVSGLPYHGFDSDTGMKYGIIGWGRAVGWLMSGISESLAYLPEKTPQFSFIREHFKKLAGAAVPFQREDGSFSWQLQAREGPGDTSATAMIACALLRGIQFGSLEESYEENVYKAGEYLLSRMKNGRVEQCSAECEGFSQYPQRYGNYPWADGPVLRLFGMMEEM